MRSYGAYYLLLRKRSDRILEKVEFSRNRPIRPHALPAEFAPPRLARRHRDAPHRRDFGGSKIEGGLITPAFNGQSGAAQLRVVAGKVTMASDALQLDGKGLPEASGIRIL